MNSLNRNQDQLYKHRHHHQHEEVRQKKVLRNKQQVLYEVADVDDRKNLNNLAAQEGLLQKRRIELELNGSSQEDENQQQHFNDHNRYLLRLNNTNNLVQKNHNHSHNKRRQDEDEDEAEAEAEEEVVDEKSYSLEGYKSYKSGGERSFSNGNNKLNPRSSSENIIKKLEMRNEKLNKRNGASKKRNGNLNVGTASATTSSSSIDENENEDADCREFSIVYCLNENGIKTVANISDGVVLVANKTTSKRASSSSSSTNKKNGNNLKNKFHNNNNQKSLTLSNLDNNMMLSGDKSAKSSKNRNSATNNPAAATFECSTSGSMKSVCDSNSSSTTSNSGSSGFSSVPSNETLTSTIATNQNFIPNPTRGSNYYLVGSDGQRNEQQQQQQEHRMMMVMMMSQRNRNATSRGGVEGGPFNPKLKQQRGKVIDDLDRLLLTEAGSRQVQPSVRVNTNSVSPTESYISNAESTNQFVGCDTTLTRGHEIDYSTLCRDEFSSFISGDLEEATLVDASRQRIPNRSGPAKPNTKREEEEREFYKFRNCYSLQKQYLNNEFSKTKTKSKTSKKNSIHRSGGGPTLIGVHDNVQQQINAINSQKEDLEEKIYSNLMPTSSAEMSPTSEAGNDEDLELEEDELFEVQETFTSPISSSCMSTPTNSNSSSNMYELEQHSSMDQELLLIETSENREQQQNHYNEPFKNREEEEKERNLNALETIMLMKDESLRDNYKLTDSLFETYLDRIEALIRLSQGDKSISMRQAFGGSCDDLANLIVSDELKTEIEYSPCQQNNPAGLKVVQEVEMTTTSSDDDDDEASILKTIERRIIKNDFLAILSAPQTSATLNWSSLKNSPKENDQNFNHRKIEELKLLRRGKRFLEESLIKRFSTSSSSTGSSNKTSTLSKAEQSLQRVVERHVSEFIEDYISYQIRLIESNFSSSTSNGWRQNWLFSSKRLKSGDLEAAGSLVAPKRPKMANSNLDSEGIVCNYDNCEENHCDLIRYSTLLLSSDREKIKPSMNYIISVSSTGFNDSDDDSDRFFKHVNNLYEAEEDTLKELYEGALRLSCQADVCRMLLHDLCGEQSDEKAEMGTKQQNKLLTVNYDTTNHYKSDSYLTFSAYGYLFECFDKNLSKLKTISENNSAAEKLAFRSKKKIEEKLLDKLYSITLIKKNSSEDHLIYHHIQDKLMAQGRFEKERVKFLIDLNNDFELTNNLKVIQFCSKISGALPIIVRWFKVIKKKSNDDDDGDGDSLVELSDTVSGKNRIRLRESLPISRSTASSRTSSKCWPLEMQANYDYEYQNNNSLSWFRFKRVQGDILFEIREANLELDYDQMYKCVIENYCSKEECCFTLRKRKLITTPTQPMAKKLISPNNNNKPILRTWSQRTLHKPKPSTNYHSELSSPSKNRMSPCKGSSSKSSSEEKTSNLNSDNEQASSDDISNSSCWRQTVGLRSSQLAKDEKSDKNFGKDFPYHPENLLKRLEENKFSSLTFRTLSRVQAAAAASSSSDGRHQTQTGRSQEGMMNNNNSKRGSPTECAIFSANKQIQRQEEETSSWQNNMIQSEEVFNCAADFNKENSRREEMIESKHDYYKAVEDVQFDFQIEHSKNIARKTTTSMPTTFSGQQKAADGVQSHLLAEGCCAREENSTQQETKKPLSTTLLEETAHNRDSAKVKDNGSIQPRPRLTRQMLKSTGEEPNQATRFNDLENRKQQTTRAVITQSGNIPFGLEESEINAGDSFNNNNFPLTDARQHQQQQRQPEEQDHQKAIKNNYNDKENNKEVVSRPARQRERGKTSVNSHQSNGLESNTTNNGELKQLGGFGDGNDETSNNNTLTNQIGQQRVVRSNVKSLISRFNLQA